MTPRDRIDVEEIKARNPVADVASRYVTLRKAGRNMVGPCPVCGGGASAQRFEVIDDGWVCAVCEDGGDVIRLVEKVENCSFLQAIERLGGRVDIDADEAKRREEEREAKRQRRDAEAQSYRDAERKRLYQLWIGAQRDIGDTAAGAYLRGRGLIIPPQCPGLRFLPSAAYFHGDEIDERGLKVRRVVHRGPAMLGAFIRGDGTFGGLHFTYITTDDPPQKVALIDPDTDKPLPAKKMRGSKTGAHILVAPAAGAPQRLVIGEGIETVLSVYTALVAVGRDIADMAFWAAGDLGNLAGRATEAIAHPTLRRPDGKPQRPPGPMPDMTSPAMTIPDSVTELLLLGDGDSDPVATHCAMERAARRYARAGRTIRVQFAPMGEDFNNVLRGGE